MENNQISREVIPVEEQVVNLEPSAFTDEELHARLKLHAQLKGKGDFFEMGTGRFMFRILPLGEEDTEEVVAYAYRDVLFNYLEKATLLLPADTNTPWFHKYVLPHADIEFLEGYDYPALVAVFSRERMKELAELCRKEKENEMTETKKKTTPRKVPTKPVGKRKDKPPMEKSPLNTNKGNKLSPSKESDEWKTTVVWLESTLGVKPSTIVGWLGRRSISQAAMDAFARMKPAPTPTIKKNLNSDDRQLIKKGLNALRVRVEGNV